MRTWRFQIIAERDKAALINTPLKRVLMIIAARSAGLISRIRTVRSELINR